MSTFISVEIDEKTLTRLVIEHLNMLLTGELKPEDVTIEVKTKQNYRAEWERGQFRARVEKRDFEQ